MADGRARFEWGIASSQMALMANLQRDPKKGQPFKASDVNPFAPKEKKIVLRVADMKDAHMAAFVRRRS